MAKIALLILADTETHGDLGRVVNALQVAREFLEAGDQVHILFDGAGTRWIPKLSDPNAKGHALFRSVQGAILGACSYCAGAFGVKEEVAAAGFRLLDDFSGHPSLRRLILDGYQVLTF